MFYHLVKKSENAKVGAIPVTMSNSKTCPSSCVFKNNGCYAGQGPCRWQWDKVNNGKMGTDFSSHAKNLSSLPDNQLTRLNVCGDLPGTGNRINFKQLNKLVKAGKNKRFFSYSHKPVEGDSYVAKNNRNYIKFANSNGLTINLSANNLIHADRLIKLNIGPVVTILPGGSPNVCFTPEGNKVVKCPAQTKNVTCSQCKLCQKANRNLCIGFESHGTMKKRVDSIFQNYH
jgi:hypothetical protein